MKKFICCVKEFAIMFALVSLVVLSAFGGAALLLRNM